MLFYTYEVAPPAREDIMVAERRLFADRRLERSSQSSACASLALNFKLRNLLLIPYDVTVRIAFAGPIADARPVDVTKHVEPQRCHHRVLKFGAIPSRYLFQSSCAENSNLVDML